MTLTLPSAAIDAIVQALAKAIATELRVELAAAVAERAPTESPGTMWLKAADAAAYCGGVSEKTLRRAVQSQALKVSRVGSGRNMLFYKPWLDEWLLSRPS